MNPSCRDWQWACFYEIGALHFAARAHQCQQQKQDKGSVSEPVKEFKVGVSNAPLTIILRAIKSDIGRTPFEKFCHCLTASIRSTFKELARVPTRGSQAETQTLPEVFYY